VYDLTQEFDAYIAGPMTGHRDYNFAAFYDAERRFTLHGLSTINPARHDEDMNWVTVERDPFGGILRAHKRDEGAFDWATALDWDLQAIDQCRMVYVLPGWSKSRGATKEVAHARATGKLVVGALGEEPAVVKHQPLVGLVGYAQAGKDTFAGYLGYQRLAFADPLKQLALACNPPVYNMGLRYYVETDGWEFAKSEVPGVREFLQDLGVGARDILDPDIWVKAAFAKYDPSQPTVFTDVRFPNEIAAIRERGGAIVRIDRVGHAPVNSHVSEFAWQAETPDYHPVFADGGLSEMARYAAALDRTLREKG
jgi:hypothetical protein